MDLIEEDGVTLSAADKRVIRERVQKVRAAEQELNQVLRTAVEQGAAFTELSQALGCTEGAIRTKAKRMNWYVAGSRRGRIWNGPRKGELRGGPDRKPLG